MTEKARRQIEELGDKLAALIVLRGSLPGMLIAADAETLRGIGLLERDDELPAEKRLS